MGAEHRTFAVDIDGAQPVGLRPLVWPDAPGGGIVLLVVLWQTPTGYHVEFGRTLHALSWMQQAWWVAHLHDRIWQQVYYLISQEDAARHAIAALFAPYANPRLAGLRRRVG